MIFDLRSSDAAPIPDVRTTPMCLSRILYCVPKLIVIIVSVTSNHDYVQAKVILRAKI